MEASTKNNHYFVQDTGFAAFLVISGARLVYLDTKEAPAKFCFEYGNLDFDNLKFQWETGIAQGNLSAFLKAFRGFNFEINKAKRRAFP